VLPAPALRVVYDPGGDVMARFGAAGMPSLYVIDRRGIVRAVVTDDEGGRLREVVEGHVNRLLAEPSVSRRGTPPSVGVPCSR
jgi:hypothetical protein